MPEASDVASADGWCRVLFALLLSGPPPLSFSLAVALFVRKSQREARET
jgi:hypothetical protein